LHARFRAALQKSESRVSAQPRNPANEMRFPVSREEGGNALALSHSAEAAAGHPSQERAPALRSTITALTMAYLFNIV